MKWQSIKQDVFASITVALVAIPLCLGIALASGAPLFSGILTGIIGGIVVGLISESRVSVSGPAAGMIAVIIGILAQLGSYELFLTALFIAGIMQLIAGMLRAGFIANYIPANVIQGLLAAIGVLIIVKQLPIALGYYHDSNTIAVALKNTEETLSIPYIFHALQQVHITAVSITCCSLIILLTFEKNFPKAARVLPASVLVVITAILLNVVLKYWFPQYALQSSYLVNIPVNHSLQGLISQFRLPDWSALYHAKIYAYAGMIAAIASLETLLNLEGIEKIDKQHRYTSRNRELVAQGAGNMVSGLLGGLPVTSVIVRSSVNIQAGAQSKLSTIFHGILLFISVAFIPKYLNDIPLAALAAILIHTGYKLASVTLFKKAYREGMRYFLPFLITTIAIVFSNLLTGILIGLTVSILFILHYNSKNSLMIVSESHTYGNLLRLILPQQMTFLSKAAVIDALNEIPAASKVIIDAHSTDYIDTDVLGIIKDFKEEQAPEKNILLNLIGFKDHYNIPNEVKFIHATTHDVQLQLTPNEVLRILMEGNNRFSIGTPIHKDFKHQLQITSASQHPIGVVLSCIDSRVPVEIIFDLTLGDLFVTRVAGNIGNLDIVASIEFACQVAGAKLVVVLGHKECGAIKAACEHFRLGHITQLLDKIKPAIAMEKETHGEHQSKTDFVNHVAAHNVRLTQHYLLENSTILKNLLLKNEINVIGAIYDVQTGVVQFNSEDGAVNASQRS